MDFHWLRLRATAHPTEDPERVAQALRQASGLDDDRFAAALTQTPLETHHGATQHLLEVELRRNRDCRAALEAMLAADGTRAAVLGSLEARLDDDGVLYLRLDKQAAHAGRLVVGTFDDPVSVRAKVQAHPFSRERALALWQAWLSP